MLHDPRMAFRFAYGYHWDRKTKNITVKLSVLNGPNFLEQLIFMEDKWHYFREDREFMIPVTLTFKDHFIIVSYENSQEPDDPGESKDDDEDDLEGELLMINPELFDGPMLLKFMGTTGTALERHIKTVKPSLRL